MIPIKDLVTPKSLSDCQKIQCKKCTFGKELFEKHNGKDYLSCKKRNALQRLLGSLAEVSETNCVDEKEGD